MRQLTQKLKDGAVCVHEVPIPALGSGTVLVRNLYSLVSAGTEGSTVKAARANLFEKAKQRLWHWQGGRSPNRRCFGMEKLLNGLWSRRGASLFHKPKPTLLFLGLCSKPYVLLTSDLWP